jgi:cephalosporin hydroxylase
MPHPPPAPGLPPSVEIDPTGGELRSYWLSRARQHVQDSYAGVKLSKFPEDLRVYEHLLWLSASDTVIELGTDHGASALWFRDRLRALRDYGRIERPPQVITIDIDQSAAGAELVAADPAYAEEIDLVAADVTDPELPQRIASMLRPEARCFVCEDSAHVFETTLAALEGFAPFVPDEGFLVVEDTCVDIEPMRLTADWPHGVRPALDKWLATREGSQFVVRRDLELYGLSCHPGGFLQRQSQPSAPEITPASA